MVEFPDVIWERILKWMSERERGRVRAVSRTLAKAEKRLWEAETRLELCLCRVFRWPDSSPLWSFGVRVNDAAYSHDRLWAAKGHLRRLLLHSPRLRLSLDRVPHRAALRSHRHDLALAIRY